MTIGDVIKTYREEHDISQRQFAQLCGMSNGYISILEDGKHPKTNEPVVPTISTMRKLALAMNISLSDLMSIIDDTKVVLSDEPELPPKSSPFPSSVFPFWAISLAASRYMQMKITRAISLLTPISRRTSALWQRATL